MVFSVKIRVRNKVRAMGKEVRRAVGESIRDIADAILLEADKNVPPGATAALKQSGHRIPANPTTWAAVRYATPYALYVHEGTRAHWPPKGVLVRWIQLVLGKTPKEAERLDYVIRRKIARFGTKANPWLRKAWETVAPHVQAIVERRFQEAGRRLAPR